MSRISPRNETTRTTASPLKGQHEMHEVQINTAVVKICPSKLWHLSHARFICKSMVSLENYCAGKTPKQPPGPCGAKLPGVVSGFYDSSALSLCYKVSISEAILNMSDLSRFNSCFAAISLHTYI
jgi:hypothetical protein